MVAPVNSTAPRAPDYVSGTEESEAPPGPVSSAPSQSTSRTGVQPEAQGRSRDDVLGQAGPVSGSAANAASGGGEATAALASLKTTLKRLAADKGAFEEVLNKAFGSKYDKAGAEKIRQQVQSGDFSWLPKIEVVDQSVLGDASGAYSKSDDTVFISRQLLSSDPAKAAKVLLEEVGHGLDARLNTSDAAGDEGNIFARLASGEKISAGELKELKAENDHGTIKVGGKEVEVEFFSLKKAFKKLKGGIKKSIKKVTGGLKKTFNKVKSLVKKGWKKVWSGVQKVLNSPIFAAVLTVCSFIPITAPFAAIGRVALGAYQAYKGIKAKSFSMVLGGIATAATGAGKFAGALNATKTAATLNTVGNYARTASAAYSAVAKKDFGAALSLISSKATPGTSFAKNVNRLRQTYQVVNLAKKGDYLGAASVGAGVLKGLPGTGYDKFLGDVQRNTGVARAIQIQAKGGNIQGAAAIFTNVFGPTFGIDAAAGKKIMTAAGAVETLSSVRDAARSGNYEGVTNSLLSTLGIDLGETGKKQLHSAFSLRQSVLNKDYSGALANLTDIAGRTSNQGAQEIIGLVNQVNDVRNLARGGNYETALTSGAELLGINLSKATRESISNVNQARSAFRTGDVQSGLTHLSALAGADASKKLQGVIDVVGQIDTARAQFLGNDYAGGLDTSRRLLNLPLSDNALAQIDGAFSLKDQVGKGQYLESLKTGAGIAERSGNPALAKTLLGLAERLENPLGRLPTGTPPIFDAPVQREAA